MKVKELLPYCVVCDKYTKETWTFGNPNRLDKDMPYKYDSKNDYFVCMLCSVCRKIYWNYDTIKEMKNKLAWKKIIKS